MLRPANTNSFVDGFARERPGAGGEFFGKSFMTEKVKRAAVNNSKRTQLPAFQRQRTGIPNLFTSYSQVPPAHNFMQKND
jgi:hypothetical protein